jgi:hypothetical protein
MELSTQDSKESNHITCQTSILKAKCIYFSCQMKILHTLTGQFLQFPISPVLVQILWWSTVSENKVLCHPASVDSLSTSAGTEDHVSMGCFAARKAIQVSWCFHYYRHFIPPLFLIPIFRLTKAKIVLSLWT